MNKDEQDKRQMKEWKRNPMINLADSINRSMVGDPGAFAKNGCLTNILVLFILIIGLFLLSKCAN